MTEGRGVVVIGASSGIGEALAREHAARGDRLGLTARRRERLETIGAELPTHASVARMDVTDVETARETFAKLVDAMDGVDVVYLNAGVGFENPTLDWEAERTTVDVNVRGFVALATAAMAHFEEQGSGHLVGISSLAAHFASGPTAAYSASKAFVSTYCDGLRYRARNLDADVRVTTIEPGYVDTELAGGTFWMASPETAARQIADAVDAGRRHAYITRRWRLVAWFLALLPDAVRRRVFS